jgi:hypothetical protein
MGNPFFTTTNWLLLTDAPVAGKSILDFQPANPDSPHTVWGILREGPVYEKIIPIFDSSIRKVIETEKELDDIPLSSEECFALLQSLKSHIDHYLENRPEPNGGYDLELEDKTILIDVRNNPIWDRPLSSLIRLYEILRKAYEKQQSLYLTMN